MRRRLLGLSLAFVVVLLASLTVPLLAAYTESRTSDLHADRLAAATRFATLAGASFDDDGLAALEPDLRRFAEVYDARVWVVDADDVVLASSGGPLPADDAVASAVRSSLDGVPTSPPRAAWPWRTDDLVAATPVGRDAQVLGAVVVVSDTDDVRRDVIVRIGIAAVGAFIGLGVVGWLVAIPLVGWIVRPVEDLDQSARRLADGDTTTRAETSGPPELRHLAESFNAMAESVELSRQQQRDLVGDVSHQLANPLTALRLRIEALDAGPGDLGPVLDETDRMARVLDGLIEVSRAGGFDRVPTTVDVGAQVRARVELWEPLFGDLLTTTLVEGGAPAVLEEDLVPTIVDALLDNATKYADGARVDVRLSAAGTAWLLEVRDHGTGVTPDEADSLGRRFHRLARHADVDGTGLGLAIVRGRVADAGGRVEVSSAGPGTRVVVRLPRRPGRGTSAASPGGAGSGR